MIESNEQYFRRRHDERDAREQVRGLDERKHRVPDCFSLEGLIAPNIIKPPTIEALRKALGDATFRS